MVIDEQIAYMRHLAETSVDIAHTLERAAFFPFDWEAFVADTKKGSTILFLHPFRGVYKDKKNENLYDEARIQWSVLRRMNERDRGEPERVIKETKAVAEKLLARMLWHRDDDPDGTYCELLSNFDLDDVEYSVDDVYEDGWTGYRVITPMTGHVFLEMNPDDWSIPDEPETP